MRIQTIFDPTPAAALCRSALCDDIASARLSRGFRLYYRLRRFLPLAVRQQIQRMRNRRVGVASDWYLPTAFFAVLAEEFSGPSFQLLYPWPAGHAYCLTLTHDVETAEGLRGVAALADMEQELGFRSSWNLVPYKYPIDHGLVRDLQQRGFEIGIHGYNHDGKLFWSAATFQHRAIAINRALGEFAAVGFRAPMVHRNLEWLQALDIEYDASCFDIDPFQAMPGGIGSVWPTIVGKFVELPYTLPQDHTLFVTLGEQTTRIWRDKLEFLRQQSGLALMLTHPDYLNSPLRRQLYRDFLTETRDRGGYWHALPRDVARWWRAYMQAAACGAVSCSSTADDDLQRQFAPATVSFCPDGVRIEPTSSSTFNRRDQLSANPSRTK